MNFGEDVDDENQKMMLGDHNQQEKAEDLADLIRKKPYNRKKHFPIRMTVQIPNREEVLVIEDHSSMKIKNLRQKISDMIQGTILPDQLQITLEGGQVLSKSQNTLEEYDIKSGAVLIVE